MTLTDLSPITDSDISNGTATGTGVVEVAYTTFDCPVGELVVASTTQGLVLLQWDLDSALEKLTASISPRVVERPARLDEPRRQLDEYFAGRRRTFDLPIDWTLVHGFRREVLQELGNVDFGETVSYGDLAARVGNPKAARAVGSAMANNCIAIIVPCHRVVTSGGALGNYSGRGGVTTKQFLLDHESAPR